MQTRFVNNYNDLATNIAQMSECCSTEVNNGVTPRGFVALCPLREKCGPCVLIIN